MRVSRFTREMAEFMAKGDMALAETTLSLSREYGKPILSCTDVILGDTVADNPTLELLAESGMSVYPTPARAARVLAKMAEYGEWRRKALGEQ